MSIGKLAVPVQQQVEELAAVTGIARRLVHVLWALYHLVVHLSGLRVARTGTVEGRQTMVMDGILIVSVESEASRELQSLGDEAQILLQCDIGLNGVLPLVVVTCLRRADPRVDVVFVQRVVGDTIALLGTIDRLGGIVAVAVHERCRQSIVAEELSPHFVVADAWRVALVQVAADTKFQQGGLGDVDVDVHAVVPALVVGIGAVLVLQRLVGLVHTFILGVGH